jgi:hypothetical protein
VVRQGFEEATLASLQGHLAIGHTGRSATGGSCWEHAQPVFKTNALLARKADFSLEEAIVPTMPRLEALTATAAPVGIGPARELCTAGFTGSYPIPMPEAAVADLRPSATTQPPTLPLPNP